MTTPYVALFNGAVTAAASALSGVTHTLSMNPAPDQSGTLVIPQMPTAVRGQFSHKGRDVPDMTQTWTVWADDPTTPATVAALLVPALSASFSVSGATVILYRLDMSLPLGSPDEPGVSSKYGHALRFAYTLTT